MINSSPKYEIGLNIHLLSFELPKKVIKNLDEVRVSITTMPDGVKQHYTLKGKKMENTNHVFSLNISNETRRIVMVFRKRVLFNDGPIIASKTIHLQEFKELPKSPITSGSINSEVKTLNLCYPIQKQMVEEQTDKRNINRKVLGQMEIQLTFTTPYVKYKKDKRSRKDNNKLEKKSANAKEAKMRKQERKGEAYEKFSD